MNRGVTILVKFGSILQCRVRNLGIQKNATVAMVAVQVPLWSLAEAWIRRQSDHRPSPSGHETKNLFTETRCDGYHPLPYLIKASGQPLIVQSTPSLPDHSLQVFWQFEENSSWATTHQRNAWCFLIASTWRYVFVFSIAQLRPRA